ncbi:MAG: hypothetical protein IGS48_18525 [Oscillatoriales cyanobacterium C42_A2020_001]|nr:hypothetical protein [Leptolyngbyaceae cyanobacterium C42_A2020_001]
MEVRLVRSFVLWKVSQLRSVAVGALTAIVLGSGMTSGLAKSISFPPSPASTPSVQSNVLLAQRLVCRRVVREGGTPFYRNLPQPNSYYEYLDQGARVGVNPNQQVERAPDGRFYVRVAYPFNGNNALNGYVLEQYQAQNGSFRRTLGACRIMW